MCYSADDKTPGPSPRPRVITARAVGRRYRRCDDAAAAAVWISRPCRFDRDSPFFTAAITPPIVVTVAEAPAPERKKAADLADVIIAGERDVDLAFAPGVGRRSRS